MSIPLGLNTASAVASGVSGKRVDPYLGFNFLVELDGLLTGGFSQVEGLEGSIDTEEYREGGVNGYVHRFLKTTTFPPLVLSRGLTAVDTLWSWFDQTRRGVIQRRSGTVMLLDARRQPVVWWDFLGALPVKWSGPSFDASRDSQVAIERIELIHQGLIKPPASSLTSLAQAGLSLGR